MVGAAGVGAAGGSVDRRRRWSGRAPRAAASQPDQVRLLLARDASRGMAGPARVDGCGIARHGRSSGVAAWRLGARPWGRYTGMDRSWWRGFLLAVLAATVGFFLLPAGGRAQAA